MVDVSAIATGDEASAYAAVVLVVFMGVLPGLYGPAGRFSGNTGQDGPQEPTKARTNLLRVDRVDHNLVNLRSIKIGLQVNTRGGQV